MPDEAAPSLVLPNHAMTQSEVAAFLGFSLSTIKRDAARGLLHVVRRGCRCTRVYPSALAAYIRHLDPQTTVEVSWQAS